jgi:hypothetical protein
LHALFDELRLCDRVEDCGFVLKVQPFVVITNHIKTKGMEPARHFLLCVSKQALLYVQTGAAKKVGG